MKKLFPIILLLFILTITSVLACSTLNSTCTPCSGGYNQTTLANAFYLYNWTSDTNGYGDITDWNVSCITDMDTIFKFSTTFNQDIGDWDVSNVTSFYQSFYYATSFNQDLSEWNTSSATDMNAMFYSSDMNQSIRWWCVPLIASQPTNIFGGGCPLISIDEYKPIWGTCPTRPNYHNSSIGKTNITYRINVSDMNNYLYFDGYFYIDSVLNETYNISSSGIIIHEYEDLIPETSYNLSFCDDYSCTNKTFTTLALDNSSITNFTNEPLSISSINATATLVIGDYYTNYTLYCNRTIGVTTDTLYDDVELSEDYSQVVASLSSNTAVPCKGCVEYNGIEECSAWVTATTGASPTFSSSVSNVKKTNATLNFVIEKDGASNVSYQFNATPYAVATDGTYSNIISNLTEATYYSYNATLSYDTLGITNYLYSTGNFTTLNDNEFDDVWDTMFDGNSKAKIVLGVFALLVIIFGTIAVLGKYDVKLEVFGILAIVVIGTIIVTLMQLFPVYILLAIVLGSVVLAIAKTMLFGGEK